MRRSPELASEDAAPSPELGITSISVGIAFIAPLEFFPGFFYQPVDATISRSEVEPARLRKNGTGFRPAISYYYSYDGKTYHGATLRPGLDDGRTTSWAQAKAVRDRYYVGRTVVAYANPFSHRRSFLERTLGWRRLVWYLLAWSIPATVMLFHRWRSRRRSA